MSASPALHTPALSTDGSQLVASSDDPSLPGTMQTIIALKKVSCGTEVDIAQEGVPDVIPAESCYLGWQESLVLLAKLVEPEIPDEP